MLARFAAAVFFYALFQQALAMAMLWPSSLVRLTPLQPMRYLHLEYFLFMMMAGAMLGQFVLQKKRVALGGVFAGGQRQHVCCGSGRSLAASRIWSCRDARRQIPGCRRLRGSGRIRRRMRISHSIRITWKRPARIFTGFARWPSAARLADAVKDAAVVTQVPELGPVWASQVAAEEGWRNFKLADFERLKTEFGVDWVLVAYPQAGGLACRWHNDALAVCQIP